MLGLAEWRSQRFKSSGECVRMSSASTHVACNASYSSHFSMCKLTQSSRQRQQTSEKKHPKRRCFVDLMSCKASWWLSVPMMLRQIGPRQTWSPRRVHMASSSEAWLRTLPACYWWVYGWVLAGFGGHTPKSDNVTGFQSKKFARVVMSLVMPQDKEATFGMFWHGSCPWGGPKPTIAYFKGGVC